ncbi:MAG: hypothetical protein WC497_05605, partial [Patescibacteria group bacterium]
MAYEQEKKFLAETAAIRVSYWSNPQTGNAILVRRWTTSRAELQSSCLIYLNTIKTVKDPIADKCVYPGIWRVFPNQAPQKKGFPEDQQGITQTLVLSVDGDFKWSSEDSTLECMYSYAYQNKAVPIQAKVAVQGEVTEVQNTLNDQLRYDSQTRITHSHPCQWVTHTAENALATTDDIGYKNSRYCPTAPASTVQGTVYDAKSTLNKDGSYDGNVDYETSKVRELTGTVSESALGVEYEVAYVNGRTRPVVPSGTVQGVVYDAKSTVNKDDTYNGVVGYEASKQTGWSDVTEAILGTSSANSYLNYRTKPTAPSVAAVGFVYDAKLTINKDGTYSGGVGYEYSKPAQWRDATNTTLDTKTGDFYLNQRAKPAAPSGTVQGTVYDARFTLNKDGTYSGGISTEYSKPAQWVDAADTALNTVVGNSYLNQRTKVSAPASAAQGFVYDGKNTLNRDGTYNGTLGYEYAKPVMMSSVTQDALTAGYALDYLAYRTRPTAPASAVQGVIYDVKSTLARDGTYNGGVGYDYSKPVMWSDVAQTVTGVSCDNSYLNYRTRPTAPTTSAQGFIYDAKSTTNRDGTYSGGAGYEYSKPVMLTDAVQSSLAINYDISYLNYRTRPTAPTTSAQGFIYDAKSTTNRDGTYSGGAGYEYSKPVMLTDAVQSSLAINYDISYLNYRT